MEACRPIAGGHGVEIRPELDPDLPLLTLDRNRFSQVIMNLITNAVQASPSRPFWRRRGGMGVRPCWTCGDHGSGIREKDRDKLFEPFVCTQKGRTGLGLPANAGTVGVDTAAGNEISQQDYPITFQPMRDLLRPSIPDNQARF